MQIVRILFDQPHTDFVGLYRWGPRGLIEGRGPSTTNLPQGIVSIGHECDSF